MVKTKKPKEDYYFVNIRYLNPNKKQEELFKQFDEVNISKKDHREHPDTSKKSKIDEYMFYILDYDNTSGVYDTCNLIELKYKKNEYTEKDIENMMYDILGEEIDNTMWSRKTDIRYCIRLKGFKKKIDTKLSYYSIKKWNIKYPISILSYGRYNQNKTSKYLLKCKIKHYIFVEECEYDLYMNNYYNKINEEDKYLVNIINTYKDFHLYNLGGSPVRNYILDYWLKKGFERCWMLDDNINFYKRFNGGVKNKIYSDLIFSSIETYIEEYDNVGICSHNLDSFITGGNSRTIIVLNEKHYSSLLLLTDKQFRFKHKYNEDVLISIDYVISGKINFCFNHILLNKNTSGKDSGGNTNTIYKNSTNEGYKMKYDYLYDELKKMYEYGLININGDFDKFIYKKYLKSKEKGNDEMTISHHVEYKNIIVDNQTIFEPKINPVKLDDHLELR